MVRHIGKPILVRAAGTMEKRIEEFIGRANSGTDNISIARMKSPPGWSEPGQTPEFDEYAIVLDGLLRVRTRGATIDVRAGEAVVVERGEWIQYSTPEKDGAEYIAVCVPAFSQETVHREAQND